MRKRIKADWTMRVTSWKPRKPREKRKPVAVTGQKAKSDDIRTEKRLFMLDSAQRGYRWSWYILGLQWYYNEPWQGRGTGLKKQRLHVQEFPPSSCWAVLSHVPWLGQDMSTIQLPKIVAILLMTQASYLHPTAASASLPTDRVKSLILSVHGPSIY